MLLPVTTFLTQLTGDVSLTSVARGDVLYRGASKWNNLAAGTSGLFLKSNGPSADPSWASVPAATPGGSSGQLQYNNAGAFGGTAALVYATSGALLTATAQANADVPITVKGTASQSGNLQEWYNATPALRARITSAGAFSNTGGQASSEIFGSGSTVTNTENSILGNGSSSAARLGVVVGYQSSIGSGGQQAVVLGSQSSANGDQAIAIGAGTAVSSDGTIGIGASQTIGTSRQRCMLVGSGFTVTTADQIGLGFGNSSEVPFSQAGECMLGSRSATAPTGYRLSIFGTSSTQGRVMFNFDGQWATSTDATRKTRLVGNVFGTTAQEFIRGESDGTYGLASFGGAIRASTQLIVQSQTATYTPEVVKGASSQSANLWELRKSDDTLYTAFDSTGNGFVKPVTFALALGTPATTGTNKTNVVQAPYAGKIIKAWAIAKTGPTGADLIFDINLNGTSIWASTQANRVKIVATATTGTQTSFDTTTFAAGDQFTIDIDQIGSTIAGQDVTVMLTLLMVNQ